MLSLVLFALLTALVVLGGAVFTRPGVAAAKSWGIFLALLPLASSVQFWYTTIYQPAHNRPNINIEAKLTTVSDDGTTSRMEANVILENSGPTIVDLLDTAYTLTAFDMSVLAPGTPRGPTATNHHDVAWADPDGFKGLLSTGRLIRPGGHLGPGQRLETSIAFEVRDHYQDKIRFTVFLSTIADTGTPYPNGHKCHPPDTPVIECEEVAVPLEGVVNANLIDHPIAQTYLVDEPHTVPSMITHFTYGDDHSAKADATYGLLNSRGFTTSVEFSLRH